jgi:hypothetical protein
VTRGLGFPVSSEGQPYLIASYDSQRDAEDLFLPGSSRVTIEEIFINLLPIGLLNDHALIMPVINGSKDHPKVLIFAFKPEFVTFKIWYFSKVCIFNNP